MSDRNKSSASKLGGPANLKSFQQCSDFTESLELMKEYSSNFKYMATNESFQDINKSDILKASKDCTKLYQQAITLSHLIYAFLSNRFNKEQVVWILYRLYIGSRQIDNGQRFSRHDPLDKKAINKNIGSNTTGFSLDDVLRTKGVRTTLYDARLADKKSYKAIFMKRGGPVLGPKLASIKAFIDGTHQMISCGIRCNWLGVSFESNIKTSMIGTKIH